MTADFEALNFFQDPTLTADPYWYYDDLRGRCPVHTEPHHGVVMITGYDEAVEVLNDTERFSSCTASTGPFAGMPAPPSQPDLSEFVELVRDELPFSDQILCFDPPKHSDHRALLMRLITPKRLNENEAFMWALADRQIDTFIERGSCEFIGAYAGPFAMLVIADLLGVPPEDREIFSRQLVERDRRQVGSTSGAAAEHSPLAWLYERFAEYVDERRQRPRGDVLGGLASARFPDGSLPEVMDVVRIAANLFAAGQETTVRLLSSAVRIIAEEPEVQALLRADRSSIPNFVEECLRIESPVKGDFRFARMDSQVGGVDIPAGSHVMVLHGAANRDPRHFEHPAELRPDRANARQHIAFGRGVHTCPGAPLARSEGRVSIERLLDRTADIRISEAAHGPVGERRYRFVPTFILRGLTDLTIEFEPSGKVVR
jgi:cytochrome P450 family 150 subfamily A5